VHRDGRGQDGDQARHRPRVPDRRTAGGAGAGVLVAQERQEPRQRGEPCARGPAAASSRRGSASSGRSGRRRAGADRPERLDGLAARGLAGACRHLEEHRYGTRVGDEPQRLEDRPAGLDVGLAAQSPEQIGHRLVIAATADLAGGVAAHGRVVVGQSAQEKPAPEAGQEALRVERAGERREHEGHDRREKTHAGSIALAGAGTPV
jgi:hypothetical protein